MYKKVRKKVDILSDLYDNQTEKKETNIWINF